MSKRGQAEVNSSVSAKVQRVVEADAAIEMDASRVRKQTTSMEGAANSYAVRREDTIIRPNDIWVDDDGVDSDIDVIAEFEGDKYAPTVTSQPKDKIIEPEAQIDTPAETDVATKCESQGESEGYHNTQSANAMWSGDDFNNSNLQTANKNVGCDVGMSNSQSANIGVVKNQQILEQDIHYESDLSTYPDGDSYCNAFSPSGSPWVSETEEDENGKMVLKTVKKELTLEGNKLVAHLINFEKVELTTEMCEALPAELREYAELGKYKFQGASIKGIEHSAITLYLMSAFIHKSALLQHNQSNLGNNGCLKVTVTEKMLALLICVLTKYRHNSFDYSHLLECEKYLDGLNHPSRSIWECAKEEMRWMQEAGDSPFQTIDVFFYESRSELFFDDLFSRHRDLELDAKIFLICLTESEIKKSIEGYDM